MNARPDKNLFVQAAEIKRMEAAFVEKDWLVTQVIRVIQGINQEGFEIVFSGGTALSKAYNLIFRFSEDIDFRLICAPELRTRKSLSNFKHATLDALRANSFKIEEHHVKARDENRFFAIELEYESDFPRAETLRPSILVEMTVLDIQLPRIALPVSSFLNELAKQPPEVISIACIDPVESAADKLSAIAWRIPDRVRGDQYDDPSIVRHIHDLAMLKDRALAYSGFAALLGKSMQEDDSRAKNDLTLEGMPIPEKLARMLEVLSKDAAYPDEYRHFVEGVSYARTGVIPEFETALKSLKEIIELVSRSW